MRQPQHRRRTRLWVALLVVAAMAPPAWAADKDPLDVPLRQYAFLLAVALLGGLVSWYIKLRAGVVRPWDLMHLAGELVTSAFAGLLMYWLCASADTPAMITAALVGMAGHMGTRFISMFEAQMNKRWPGATNNLGDKP